MKKIILSFATLFGMTAVMFGALGAHWLKTKLGASQLHSFETGVKYQMYHAIALLALGLVYNQYVSKTYNIAAWLMIVGTISFSFSIYMLSTRGISGLSGIKFLGPVTPLGGLLLIAAWVLLLFSFLKRS